MKIVKITKTGLYYKVKFDNDEVYKFHESIIIKYLFLKKGTVVSVEALNQATLDNLYYLALDKGVNYLSTYHSRKEVVMYLRKHYEPDIADRVVLKLEELKLINDLEYAKYFVHMMKKRAYGVNKIINELKENNISSEFILEAISSYSDEEQIDNCNKCFLKYLPSLKKESKLGAKKKATNYLISHGFSNNIITIVLEKNVELLDNITDEDEILKKMYLKLLKSKNAKIDEKKFRNKVIRNLSSKGFPLYKILKIMEDGFDDDQRQNR